MTKRQFAEWAKDKFLYLDGATGSNLMKAGMPSGVCPEQWILEHPQVLIDLQKEYVLAGSNIVYAPTFSANRVKLAEYGLEDKLAEMTGKLVALSKEAVEGKALVAGDITMTGKQLKPIGDMEPETLISIYKEQISLLADAGVDLLIIETMMSLQETRMAVIAAKEICDLPIMVTMTFEKDKRTLYGTDPVTAAVVLESLGVSALGINCSTGPDEMAEMIRSMAEVVSVPIIAKPNAGLPCLDAEGNTCYNMSVDVFAEGMEKLVANGASVLGGCCGTAPEYIRAITKRFGSKRESIPVNGSQKAGRRFLASERKTVSFGLDDGFLVVGERINPTGKKKFQASLKEGSLDMVVQFAEEQEERGAKVLDVNMGMSGIDEKKMMLAALEEISKVTSLPLAIDSSHVDVIEKALRYYPGRALINSISLETEKYEKLLPLAKKYGAMFILLPLSDAGLPADMEEKKEIIHTIYNRALELGLSKEDIVVDGLVNTVGANKQAALQALDTISYCKENGFATICGLSNISFGMPERSFVNTAFLTMAISKGLTMAIANPSQELLMGCAYASDLLLAKEGSDMQYIEIADKIKTERENQAQKAVVTQPVNDEKTVTKTVNNVKNAISLDGIKGALCESVLKGNQKRAVENTKTALQEKVSAEELLNEVLMPAINKVGDLFECGKYFLPQLIASAEAMKSAVEIIEPYLLKEGQGENMPVIVIATVEGDIHDIGKNLVALMLKNCGFEVIDLGKDVPCEEIVAKAKEHNAKIIALSALMTTTMVQMKKVVNLVKASMPEVKVMIGGAVTTREYAEEIGADGYAKDAAGAVKVAKNLC